MYVYIYISYTYTYHIYTYTYILSDKMESTQVPLIHHNAHAHKNTHIHTYRHTAQGFNTRNVCVRVRAWVFTYINLHSTGNCLRMAMTPSSPRLTKSSTFTRVQFLGILTAGPCVSLMPSSSCCISLSRLLCSLSAAVCMYKGSDHNMWCLLLCVCVCVCTMPDWGALAGALPLPSCTY